MAMSRQKFDHSILREYDIRGIVGTTLRPNDAQNLGRAFGTMVRRHGGQTVAVGQDGRLSSPQIANRFRSEERRVGKACVRTVRSRRSPDNYKKKHYIKH